MLYGGPAVDALTRFKYGLNPALARSLALMMLPVLEDTELDAIVPVPLHPKRLKERGFNQSALLARVLASRLRLPYHPTVLKRIKDTVAQAGLSRTARLANLKGAFLVPRPRAIRDKRLLLVDDVVTTTATIREASATLCRAGAATVSVCAVARAVKTN